MNSSDSYDVIIVGGGLAGLSSAMLLSRKKYSVLVLEKDTYPKHKVCGEYISMESKPFLESLGLPIKDMNLPVISKLIVTDTRGNEVNAILPQGGFGISRFVLDNKLAELARGAGAVLLTKTRADNIQFENNFFTVTAGAQVFTSRMVCGAWGKRSNIDVKSERPFIQKKNSALNNYIGIKYHIRYPWQADYIGLHNFTDGYCGISQIEDGKCCMCYLTTAASLKAHGNDLKQLEREVLMKNPWLKKIFTDAAWLYESPVAISQISFDKKEHVHEHVLLIGDSAGMITPLCGNGMSMAFHSAKIAAEITDRFLQGITTRADMEKSYIAQWENVFSKRIAFGRFVQSNFGKDQITSIFLKTANTLPFVKRAMVKGASGRPFYMIN